MSKDITVVIPVKDDFRTVECVESIDTDVNILVVFNGATKSFVKSVKNALKNHKVMYKELPRPNLSWALEYGTRNAPSNLVLYIDSDCVFVNGAIDQYKKVVKKYNTTENVFKGEVIFRKGKGYISKVIADSRSHHTAEVLTAYKPPLLVDKRIIKKVGGYLFDDRLVWREDSDFDNRVREAGITIIPVPGGDIAHDPISLKTDLRSTFRYGIGLAIANVLHIKLTEVPRSVLSTLKSKGVAPALYMIFRNRVYDAGYIYTRLQIILGARKLRSKPNIYSN